MRLDKLFRAACRADSCDAMTRNCEDSFAGTRG